MTNYLTQFGILVMTAACVYALARLLRCRPEVSGITRPRRSAALAFIALTVTLAVTYTVLVVHYARHGADGNDPMMKDFRLQLLVPVIDIVPGLLVLIINREPLRSVGVTRRCLWQAAVVGAGLAAAAFYFTPGGLWGRIARVNAHKAELLLFFAFVGFGEEFLFRGLLQNRLVVWLGQWRGWLAASAVMAIAHVPHRYFIDGYGLGGSFAAAAMLLPGSLLLGWVMLRVGNLLAPAMLHMFMDWSVSL